MALKNKIKTLFWLLIFVSAQINSQKIDYKFIYSSLNKNKTKNSIRKSVDSIIEREMISGNYVLAAEISHLHSLKLYRKDKNYSQAIKYGLIKIKILNKLNNKGDSYLKALYNVGKFYYKNYEYNKAIFFFKKIIEENKDQWRIGKSYGEIGKCLIKKGEYYKAINSIKKGIRILEKEKENRKIYKSLFSQYISLANIYRNLNTKKNFDECLKSLRKANQISDLIKLGYINRKRLNNEYANYYTGRLTYNFDSAKYYYKKNLYLASIVKDTFIITTTYNNLSFIYNKNKIDSAKYLIDKGLSIVKENSSESRLYDNYCDYYLLKSDLDNALKSIHKSLELNVNLKGNIKNTPNKIALIDSKYKEHVLYCLKKKAEVLIKIYKKTKDTSYLQNAIENIKAADNLITILLESSSENKTKFFWRKQASEAYLKGVYAAFLLNNAEIAFQFMEKNKALLLTESIYKNTQQTNLPKNISEKDNQIKKHILRLQNKLESNNLETLQDSLFNAKREHEKYIDSIKLIYPNYFKNLLKIKPINLTKVQEKITKNEIIISYIWNEFDEETEHVFGLVISNNESKIFKIDNIEKFKVNLKKYRQLISKPFERKNQEEEFKKISHALYKQLLPNEEIRKLLINKNIIIVPDGDLQNIPFETLITKGTTFNYLLNTCAISYAYSMSFLEYNDEINRKTLSNYVGYAPVSFESLNLDNLNNTKEEIIEGENIIGGNTYLNTNAKKRQFLSKSNSSKIIHLATHADVSNNPWIAFSDKKLQLHELYTYKNNADLVVLSACNTSLGEVALGEGVLSLARGFFYSGAKSVVSSLWNVNDKSTSFIMTSFYENLKKGETKPEALTNAKRKYLEEHSLSEKSPYYWASFILIGDDGILEFHNYNYLKITIFSFLFLLFMFFFLKKYKKRVT